MQSHKQIVYAFCTYCAVQGITGCFSASLKYTSMVRDSDAEWCKVEGGMSSRLLSCGYLVGVPGMAFTARLS